MYAVAAELTPDTYFELARDTYAEMRATGITAVGEFHYLHHQPDGTPYDDPNEMGRALLAAADEAGIRIRLLDTCYLAAGFGQAPEGVQVRYSDGDAHAWAERVAAFDDPRVGAAIHSVRAVPRDQLTVVVEAAQGMPLHVHLSEQVAENEACLAAHRPDPDPAARRGRCPRPADDRRARHPPDRRGHPAARREPHQRLLLPDHRARPGRRHRPGAPVARRGRHPHAGLRQPCGDRPVRGDARGGDARAAGHPAARALVGHASCSPRRRTTATARSASTTPAGSPPGSGPTSSTVDLDSIRTRGTGATAETLVFAATAADVPTSRGRPRHAERRRMSSLLLTGIAELVTNDPTHDGTPLGLVQDAAVVLEGRRVAWVGPRVRRARRRRRPRPRRPRGASPASSTPTPTWSSPATGRPSSRRGWRARATPPAASAPPSPPPAPRPTSSSPPTSPGSSRRCGARAPRPWRSRAATA